ncbi:MAG: hypothetical protein U5P10_06320 [Spirochaetia bacterium]|nr:hypothetical protein [Spirochaetia bacterium]
MMEKLVDIGFDTFALKLNGGTLHIKKPLSGISGETSVGTVSIVDGTYLTGDTTHYLITDSTVYSWDGSTLDDTGFSSPPEKNGDFAAITDDGTDLYLVTTNGEVFSLTTGGVWTHITTVDGSVEAEYGSASVVTISGTDYLMIGTYNGHYQMELTSYTFTESPDDYAASYPELASALVYQVYQAPSNDDIYLATQNGLWKRTGSGKFERQ